MEHPTTEQVIAALLRPFDPKLVSWRVGNVSKTNKNLGRALCYIDARDVMRRLDEAVGATNWSDRYEVHGPKTVCYLSIRIPGSTEWVTKADAAGDSAVEAEKGAISDAFKRAAVKWGVGRYLYDVDSPQVALNDYKQILKSEYPKLQKLLPGSTLPEDDAQSSPSEPSQKAEPTPLAMTPAQARDILIRATTADELKAAWRALGKAGLQKDAELLALAQARRGELEGQREAA